MPRVKYAGLIERLRRSDLFTFRLLEGEVGRNYAKLLVHNLRRRGEIVELLKGVYSFKKSPYMMVKAMPMSYVGLGTAAFLHGMWEQVPNIVVLSPLVSSAFKGGERNVAGMKVTLRRISYDMFFGYELLYLEEIDGWIKVSDPEKTIIDMAYFNDPLLREVLENAEVNGTRLNEYLRLMERRRVRGWRSVRSTLQNVDAKAGPQRRRK